MKLSLSSGEWGTIQARKMEPPANKGDIAHAAEVGIGSVRDPAQRIGSTEAAYGIVKAGVVRGTAALVQNHGIDEAGVVTDTVALVQDQRNVDEGVLEDHPQDLGLGALVETPLHRRRSLHLNSS